jgi:hypothetical protein
MHCTNAAAERYPSGLSASEYSSPCNQDSADCGKTARTPASALVQLGGAEGRFFAPRPPWMNGCACQVAGSVGAVTVSCRVNLFRALQVRATDGDTRLGGEDIDARLVNHFLEVGQGAARWRRWWWVFWFSLVRRVRPCVVESPHAPAYRGI